MNSKLVNDGNYKQIRSGAKFRVQCMDREYIPQRALEIYMGAIKNGEDPKNICLLTSQRTRGVISVNAMNHLIQDAYNPKKDREPHLKGTDFRIGDRVMQIKNNYHAEYTIVYPAGTNERHGIIYNGLGKRWETKEREETGRGVFNGDIGTVFDISEAYNTITVLFDDGRLIDYADDEHKSLKLAYAMTVHKAQGSEFKHVIMTMSYDQYMLLSRSITYTGITRAKEQLDLLCEKNAFIHAVRTVNPNQRATRMVELLTEDQET